MGEIMLILVGIWAYLVILGAWKVWVWIWWKPKKLEKYLRQQGLRGSPYKIFHGDMRELNEAFSQAQSKPLPLSHSIAPRVMPFPLQINQRYGKSSFFWFGVTPRVNIMDPEMIKEILSDKLGHFPKSRANPLTELLVTGLVYYNGEKWAKHRRIINPAFHLEKLKMMLPAFYSSCSELMYKWEKMASKGWCEIDVWPEFQNLAGDVISKTAFGSNYKDGQRIFQLLKELGNLAIEASRDVYIPGFKFIPTKRNQRMKKLEKEIRHTFTGMIMEREKARRIGETCNADLLGLLLDSNFNEFQKHENSNSTGMSLNEVIEECKLFYVAGHETTSALLTWTIVVLSIHPEWQVRAREEVLKAFETSTKPDFESLNHLKIVTMILYEVLRLYPPVILLVRYNYKEMKVGKITIPAGVQLGLPAILIHHDRDLWGEDAQEFNPERFSGGVSKATNNQVCFFPFSWGSRACIGQTFSMLESKMALAMILQHFSFELSPTYIHAPTNILTLHPQHGAQIILHKL